MIQELDILTARIGTQISKIREAWARGLMEPRILWRGPPGLGSCHRTEFDNFNIVEQVKDGWTIVTMHHYGKPIGTLTWRFTDTLAIEYRTSKP